MGIEFTIPGRPRTWKRTESVNGRRVTPKGQRALYREIRWLARLAGAEVIEGDVGLSVEAYYKNRQSLGDCSNIVKAIEDALEGTAYNNDRQICSLCVDRFTNDDDPRTVVRIWAIGEDPDDG